MQLSTKGRYAVMAIIEVARGSSGRALPLTEIATRLQLSQAYLEQLFMKLRRRGLVTAARGQQGGYRLAKPPHEISIGEIMAAVDEPVKMTRCAGESDLGCVASVRCTTHYLWDALGSHIEQFLSVATLEDVLSGRYAPPSIAFPTPAAVKETL